jgi:predicted methyltransferase
MSTVSEDLRKSMNKYYKNNFGEEFNALSPEQIEILKKVSQSTEGLPFDTDMVYLVNRGYIQNDNGKVHLAQKGEAVLKEFN